MLIVRITKKRCWSVTFWISLTSGIGNVVDGWCVCACVCGQDANVLFWP